MDKNTSKQPKGTKRPSKPTKATKKKPVLSKKATPKPSLKPCPEKSPAHSTGGEETDGSLTEHSFYNLASDKEPTKKQRQDKKTPPKDKSPAHEDRAVSDFGQVASFPKRSHLSKIQNNFERIFFEKILSKLFYKR
ncbi:hypothetical protein DSO57_1016794 [Entomophthora muscae]|uniref:Uncharacterized protein n=1 Tax=Entomophthora muscae TaxID=34485 RepID=A0ACC2STH7_9FUNG|nr:hypothetical protein DSO57_1016794 [Entomophthora muscae]